MTPPSKAKLIKLIDNRDFLILSNCHIDIGIIKQSQICVKVHVLIEHPTQLIPITKLIRKKITKPILDFQLSFGNI